MQSSLETHTYKSDLCLIVSLNHEVYCDVISYDVHIPCTFVRMYLHVSMVLLNLFMFCIGTVGIWPFIPDIKHLNLNADLCYLWGLFIAGKCY
jgi:hypothetical protein